MWQHSPMRRYLHRQLYYILLAGVVVLVLICTSLVQTRLLVPASLTSRTACGDAFDRVKPRYVACFSNAVTPGLTVNVRDYGAIPDDTVDDTTAIQAALGQLKSGGTLYFPRGNYILGTTSFGADGNGTLNGAPNIVFPETLANVTVYGDGADETTLTYGLEYHPPSTPSAADRFRYSALVFPSGMRHVEVRDIGLRSDVPIAHFPASYSGEVNGMLFQDVDNVLIQRVHVSGFDSAGVRQTIPQNAALDARNFIVLDSVFSENRAAGLNIGSTYGALVVGNTFERNGLPGDGGTGYGFAGSMDFNGRYPAWMYIVDNVARDNMRKGLDFHAGVNLTITDNIVENNGIYGISVDGKQVDGTISIERNIIRNMNASTKVQAGFSTVPAGGYQSVFYGIAVGAYNQTARSVFLSPTPTNPRYVIRNNVIADLSNVTSNGTPISAFAYLIYSDAGTGSFLFRDNKIYDSDLDSILISGGRAESVEQGGSVSTQITNTGGTLSYTFDHNVFIVRTAGYARALLSFTNAKKVTLRHNRIQVGRNHAAAPLQMPPVVNLQRSFISEQLQLDDNVVRDTAQQVSTVLSVNPRLRSPTVNLEGVAIIPDSPPPQEEISDVSLTMVAPGDLVRKTINAYVFTIRNLGTVSAHNVVLQDPLLGNFVLQRVIGGNCSIGANKTVVCDPFDLAPQEEKTIELGFYVPPVMPCTLATVEHFGRLAVDGPDVFPADNVVAKVRSKVLCAPVLPGVDLAVTLQGPASLMRGTSTLYTFTVSNLGTVPAQNIVLTDPLRGAFVLQESQGATCRHDGTGNQKTEWGNIVCDPFTLNPGQTRTISLTFEVPLMPPCTPKTVTHSGRVTSAAEDADPNDNTARGVTSQVLCP